MKKSKFLVFISVFAATFILSSCSKDDLLTSSYNDPTIYSSSNESLFSEIIFFIKPYINQDGERKYIVSDSLYNVSIKINNSVRITSNSYQLDTLHLDDKETVGMYRTTTERIHYPVVMSVQLMPDSFTNAGEYSDLLNNYFTLSPGAYICQIESFDIKTTEGNFRKIHTPSLSVPLIVEANTVSANLGEIEVIIK